MKLGFTKSLRGMSLNKGHITGVFVGFGKYPNATFVIKLGIKWYDMWVGFYYDQMHGILYFCPLPMLVIAFQYIPKIDTNKYLLGRINGH